MVSSFLIALREGLEAALIVGILIAYVVKTARRHLLTPIWSGVGIALVLSIALGGFLAFTSAELSSRGEEFFAGTTSLVAVVLVTWMVFWMQRTARQLKGELQEKVESAATVGPLAIASAAFFAVVREGLETSLFVYSNFQTVGSKTPATIGLISGLALSVILGYLIYRGAIRFNLSTFFTATGVALIVVAAGVLSYGVHEFQELGWLPGNTAYAWDLSSWLPKDSLLASLLSGTIGFDVNTSWLQLFIWAAYLVIVLALYLKPSEKKAPVLVAK
ncbi:MAG: FTR1 family protein [Actinomycetales bacterium]|jgi:high-affinity iron transporter|nr:FTR1 family protein [Actinomycetales bacterium]